MSKVSTEVTKNATENNASLLRRFSKKVQESGIIYKIKNNRYNEREKSKIKLKDYKLKRIARRVEVLKLIKLGKMVERTRNGYSKSK